MVLLLLGCGEVKDKMKFLKTQIYLPYSKQRNNTLLLCFYSTQKALTV